MLSIVSNKHFFLKRHNSYENALQSSKTQTLILKIVWNEKTLNFVESFLEKKICMDNHVNVMYWSIEKSVTCKKSVFAIIW